VEAGIEQLGWPIPAIDILAMPDRQNDDNQNSVSNLVDDALLADPNAVPLLLAFQHLDPRRARVGREGVNPRPQTLLHVHG
jgi:hypothetical protein